MQGDWLENEKQDNLKQKIPEKFGMDNLQQNR